MRHFMRRALLAGGAIAVMVGASGCTRVRSHQGFLFDTVLLDSIQPGLDNRASVEGTLGRPTFASQFGQQDWYYVARDAKQLAFSTPKPVSQTVLHVRFDAAGNVASVTRTGMEQIARISPVGDKTPTLGKHRSLLDELFGNIGAVGAGGAGAPPPTGNGPNGI